MERLCPDAEVVCIIWNFAGLNGSRPDLAKFDSNKRMQSTSQENKVIVHGNFAFFGTYLIGGVVIIQHFEDGSWPA
jgi:hypothetical protein